MFARLLKGWLRKKLAAFEREYAYDASYLHEVLDTDPEALLRFSKVMGLSRYRKRVSRDAWYAAKLAGTLGEDCGPCTQLVVTMAEREGVAPAVIRAVLAGEEAGMSEDARLGWRFARAALAHDPAADDLREQVLSRWGRQGLLSLALALTASRLYPTLKYALGHGQACVRVAVAGQPVAVAQPVTA